MRDDLLHMPPEDLAPYLAKTRDPAAVPELLRCLDDEAVAIRRAAAKTLRFVAARRPGMVQPWAAALLDRVEQLTEHQPLWQLIAACWPLRWDGGQGPTSAARAMAAFQKRFDEGRSIAVCTNAMQAMVETAAQYPVYRDEVRKLVEYCETRGIFALAARARQMRRRFKVWL